MRNWFQNFRKRKFKEHCGNEIVSEDSNQYMFRVKVKLHINGRVVKAIIYSCMVLIPKKRNPVKMLDYRLRWGFMINE